MLKSILVGRVSQLPAVFAAAANRYFSSAPLQLCTRTLSFFTATVGAPSTSNNTSTSRGACLLPAKLSDGIGSSTMITIRGISSGRSRRGLYDGKDIRSGNQISFSARKTRRKFKPNAIIKRVYSETLDQMLRFHMTTATLRSIDKAGGLDNYLLTTKHIGEGEGLVAKRRILKKKRKVERQRLSNLENVEGSV